MEWKVTGLGHRRLAFELQLRLLWACHLIFINLHFLFCKSEKIVTLPYRFHRVDQGWESELQSLQGCSWSKNMFFRGITG